MRLFRVTKYNPKYRNSEGHYLPDEWTCPSEVGKVFNGNTFTKKQYFEIENKYIEAIVSVLQFENLDHLRITNLCTDYCEENLADKTHLWLVEKEFTDIELFEDKPVLVSELPILLKMIFRNFIWCKLEINNLFYLSVEWDFYMFIATPNCNRDTFNEAQETGLFVEEVDSTFSPHNGMFQIDYGRKNTDLVEGEVSLENMSVEKIKSGLSLSDEHTGSHNFEITNDNCSMFLSEMKFDFDKFDYYLFSE
ncbi:MAG: hypothetical protein COA78_11800 [Blastopirellula sp.]|nr:MAG: hypothetical protein COA78_11800 [Blastopirellula sp.]